MDAAARDFVRRRAVGHCEYCRLHQDHAELTHHIEHIVARQHGGGDDPNNLALACHRCNLQKGPNLTGIDPETKQLVPLFHPRRDVWSEHFLMHGPLIDGVTAISRATVQVLLMNDPRSVEIRRALLDRAFPT